MNMKSMTGYPSIDKPWLKYYNSSTLEERTTGCTAFDLIYENNRNNLKQVAFLYFGREITYWEFFSRIRETAQAFWGSGVRKGDVVTVAMLNIPETMYIMYALDRLGAISNMIDPRMPIKEIGRQMKELKSSIFICMDTFYPNMKKGMESIDIEKVIVVPACESMSSVKKVIYYLKKHLPNLDEKAVMWEDFIIGGKGEMPNYPVFEKNRCFLIAHTSGTTATPKMVMLTNENFNSVAYGYKSINVPFERQQTYFADLPPFVAFDLSQGIHSTLFMGLKIILHPFFSPKAFPKYFRKYKPNHFCAGADHLKNLCKAKETQKMDMSFLISAGMGGDALKRDAEKEINDFLKNHNCSYSVMKGYGLTELTATVCISFEGANDDGSVGVPLIMNNVKIMDYDGNRELKYDEIGEIWVSGPTVMLGYFNMDSETERVIKIDEQGERWFRTADLGYISEDGLLYHKGRIRRIFSTLVKGQPAKIFPMQIEDKLRKCEDIYDCRVVGREMKASTYCEIVAFVIPSHENFEKRKIIKKLNEMCNESIPSYMRPVEYRFIENFPQNALGKVDFMKLEAMCKR